MPFRRLYWYLVMRFGVICMREWAGALANSSRVL
jgi:hypothetical protein